MAELFRVIVWGDGGWGWGDESYEWWLWRVAGVAERGVSFNCEWVGVLGGCHGIYFGCGREGGGPEMDWSTFVPRARRCNASGGVLDHEYRSVLVRIQVYSQRFGYLECCTMRVVR